MNLRSALLLIAVRTVTVCALAQSAPVSSVAVPMAADAHPSFAVATIKPHDPNSSRQGINPKGDRLTIQNESVSSLIAYAYSIHHLQVVNAPAWVENAPYDIEGKTETEGEPSSDQQKEMLKKLLADRFALKFHREKRELSVYAIRVTKGGPKLSAAVNPDALHDQHASTQGTEMTQKITSASMADFMESMQFFLSRPIIDQTGLTGRYDFTFRYTYDEADSTDPNAAPGFFTAIQEQLGLKFEPAKAPTDVFVIDHVEKPSAN